MPMKVTWLGRVTDKVEATHVEAFTLELKRIFPRAKSLVVCDCFSGYSENHAEKAVFGIEVRSSSSYHTHVVKLGTHAKVAQDYTGWRKCVLGHNFASRIMVSLAYKDLPHNRAAVIYEDAQRFFGSARDGQGALSLEKVLFWAVLDGKPSAHSIERVIRQIYADFQRCFYDSGRCDNVRARRFYRARIRRALSLWKQDEWRLALRRDLAWLLRPSADNRASDQVILDPYDYVGWALEADAIPETLVGRSHGDLHGRNIYVGVQRGEAEYPVVFDYGEMTDRNVLVWDFVKLETELKVRLLPELYANPRSRQAILDIGGDGFRDEDMEAMMALPTATLDNRSLRADQLRFAYRFESILGTLTARLHRLADPDAPEPPGGRHITVDDTANRALAILLRIRQEAALCLGDAQPQRGKRGAWRDEYLFGLAVYGLSTAKFNYKETESAYALVSACAACTAMESAQRAVRDQIAAPQLPAYPARHPKHPYPSYQIPLQRARRAWRGRKTARSLADALALLDHAYPFYPGAIPLMQTYALLLAEAGRSKDALDLLQPLNDLCRVFRDGESLSRMGRTYKDLGDHALTDRPTDVAHMTGHPAQPWYAAALHHYADAFDLTGDYYPGVNAATLALILGDRQRAEALAARVFDICANQDIGELTSETRFWLLVSQGEAKLLLGENGATYYRQALRTIDARDRGLAQSAYNQVCRLQWAGAARVGPVMTVFRNSPFKLKKVRLTST